MDQPPVSATEPVSKAFLSNLTLIRERARSFIEQGAVTPGYDTDLETVLRGHR
jgi:hypothetical protein